MAPLVHTSPVNPAAEQGISWRCEALGRWQTEAKQETPERQPRSSICPTTLLATDAAQASLTAVPLPSSPLLPPSQLPSEGAQDLEFTWLAVSRYRPVNLDCNGNGCSSDWVREEGTGGKAEGEGSRWLAWFSLYLECSYLQGLIKITDALLQSSRDWSTGQANAHPAPAGAAQAHGDASPPLCVRGVKG